MNEEKVGGYRLYRIYIYVLAYKDEREAMRVCMKIELMGGVENMLCVYERALIQNDVRGCVGRCAA